MPSDKDFVVEVLNRVPDGSVINVKPCYLITLTEKEVKDTKVQSKGSKAKASVPGPRNFVAIELPNMQNSVCVHTKGFYDTSGEENIIANFRSLVSTIDREQILELYIPWHSIVSIRSLVFKAK